MKTNGILIAPLLPLVVLLCACPPPCLAQEPTQAPGQGAISPATPSAPTSELYEKEARQIAFKRVPGKTVGESEFEPTNNVWIFHVLDAKGRECVVTVAQKTRSVSKVVVPRLAVKQALAIALRKVPGKRSERRNDWPTFDPKRADHTFYIDTPKHQPIQVVTVSDKTGKVISVTDMGDAG